MILPPLHTLSDCVTLIGHFFDNVSDVRTADDPNDPAFKIPEYFRELKEILLVYYSDGDDSSDDDNSDDDSSDDDSSDDEPHILCNSCGIKAYYERNNCV